MGNWEERRTLILINLASIMDTADQALLPAVYKEVGAALNVTPISLGSLTLFRSFVQALCYPLAAYVATRYNRARIIAFGAFLWSASTFLVAISHTFLQIAIFRALNGIGLALVIPAIQSLVADSTKKEKHGAAFGWLQFTGFIGSIIGTSLALLLAPISFVGIDGWRISFHIVAIISIIVGLLVWFYVVDPLPLTKEAERKSTLDEAKDFMKEVKSIIQIPTFQVVIAQGVPGNFAGAAMSFLPMWAELIGFSHGYTAFLMMLSSIGIAIGGVFGGMMGDFLAKDYPNCGRIILSQISAASNVLFGAVLLLALPCDPSTRVSHAVTMLVMSLLDSWCAPATNNPIFAEIVPEKSRTSIYALDRSFETLLSSFAPPIVGILAENIYGYKLDDNKNNIGNSKMNQENAASLAKAMYTCLAISMSICCFLYSFLYCTYPRDRERARMDSLVKSKLREIELELECEDEMNHRESERDFSTEKLLPHKLPM
ncbi:hypothetical protein LUZ60_003029 [Juncus effusus]|nr:hypothetical protein LUZ60_003029 [Juncus effusus]